MDPQQEPERLSLPTEPSEFDSDDRISFSRLDNKFIAVQDDGTELEFDSQLKRWVPMLDEELLREQQRAYMVPGVDEDDVEEPQPNRKRRRGNANGGEENGRSRGGGGKRSKNGAGPTPRQNTAVYVTGLPLDGTVDEVYELFSRKGGVVAEEIDSGKPRIKMYTDAASGLFKGDALVVFFKPQSVDMAIMLLDDTPFRVDESGGGVTSGKMRVQAADASYKKTNYEAADAKGAEGGKDAAQQQQQQQQQQQPRPERSERDKQKIIKKTQKMAAKLADWSDDEPYPGGEDGVEAAANAKLAAKEKMVVLKHMFTLEELAADADAEGEIRQDVLDECGKVGPVTKVTLYDLEPDGVVTVKFRDPASARECVKVMHGRSFGGQTVEAAMMQGKPRFKKTAEKKDGDGEESE